MAVSPLDQVFDPGELNDEVALPIADNTMWLALSTPFIDPSGSSDGAVAATMRRAIARVATTRRSPRQWIGRADDVNLRHWQRDRAIMDALGCSTRRTAPWTGLHPGDLVQLRVFLIDAARDSTARLVRTVERSGEIGPIMRAVEAAGQALVLADAAPFFVPAGIAAALMSSDPPDDTLAASIRLPFRSVFVFFDAIPLGDLEIDSNLTDSLTGEVVELGSSALVGVVLHAGPDGVGLDDDVYWILTNPIRDTYGVSLLPRAVALQRAARHRVEPRSTVHVGTVAAATADTPTGRRRGRLTDVAPVAQSLSGPKGTASWCRDGCQRGRPRRTPHHRVVAAARANVF